MKTEGITAIKKLLGNFVSPKKTEKAATVAIKDGGERMIANGQDAAAVQGRAMVKPYVKPEMKEVKLEKHNVQAASNGGWTPDGGHPNLDEEPDCAREFDFDVWE